MRGIVLILLLSSLTFGQVFGTLGGKSQKKVQRSVRVEPSVKFLGAIHSPSYRRAIFLIRGKYRIFAEGERWGGVKVLEINERGVLAIVYGRRKFYPFKKEGKGGKK